MIIFGAGPTGKRLLQDYKKQFEIVAFTDNDADKWGNTLDGIEIIPPSRIPELDVAYVLLASVQGCHSIRHQLEGMGINSERILTGKSYSIPFFIKNFARDVREQCLRGAVAEVGVFQGETARYLNEFFPDRSLYLFDTFCGFAEQDVALESAKGYSAACAGNFQDTSVELVLSKMPHPENVVIKAGYFPETAENLRDMFVLARLDADLYKPTSAGLEFFARRMAPGGIILIHDYYTESYAGVRAAVDEFMRESGRRLRRLPAGDMMSCVIAGF